MKFFDNFGGFRASVEAFFCELASLKSKDKKKFSKAQQLCENMLIGQDEDSKIEILKYYILLVKMKAKQMILRKKKQK